MREYRTWPITCPEDVAEFIRESLEWHHAADLTLYVDDDAYPVFEATREEFLRKAQGRAEREKFEIKTANTVSHRGGTCTTLLECWIPDGDDEDDPPEETPKPEAKPGTGLLRPVFEYMRWSTPTPEEDNWTHWYEKEDTFRRIICPEPTCLYQWDDCLVKGRVIGTGEEGQVNILATPCWRHQNTFSFEPGWYHRFADVYYEELLGPPEPRTCTQCGHRYTSFLWGQPWDWCPLCTYREMERSRIFDLRTHAMEMGRRHGLGFKAMQHDHLPDRQREEALETLLDFIRRANSDRIRKGEDPNSFHDLEPEYDRLRPIAKPGNGGQPCGSREGLAA